MFNKRYNDIFDTTPLEDIPADKRYTDFKLADDFPINYLSVDVNGIYVVIQREKISEKEAEEIHKRIANILRVHASSIFCFFYIKENSYFYYNKLIEIDDIYESIANLSDNFTKPYSEISGYTPYDLLKPYDQLQKKADNKVNLNGTTYELDGVSYVMKCDDKDETGKDTQYVRNILEYDMIDMVNDTISEIIDQTAKDGYKTIDGVTYISRIAPAVIHTKLGNIDTGLSTNKKVWYPVSDEDPDAMAMRIIFGGVFGINKFYTGNIGSGIFYAVTAGFFGIAPLLDLITLYTGNAYYTYADYYEDEENGKYHRNKVKAYIRKPSKKWMLFAGLVTIPLEALLSWKLISVISGLLGIAASKSKSAQNAIQSIVK